MAYQAIADLHILTDQFTCVTGLLLHRWPYSDLPCPSAILEFPGIFCANHWKPLDIVAVGRRIPGMIFIEPFGGVIAISTNQRKTNRDNQPKRMHLVTRIFRRVMSLCLWISLNTWQSEYPITCWCTQLLIDETTKTFDDRCSAFVYRSSPVPPRGKLKRILISGQIWQTSLFSRSTRHSSRFSICLSLSIVSKTSELFARSNVCEKVSVLSLASSDISFCSQITSYPWPDLIFLILAHKSALGSSPSFKC